MGFFVPKKFRLDKTMPAWYNRVNYKSRFNLKI